MFRLAKELGRTVERLASELTVDEFHEWLEFWALEREVEEAAMSNARKNSKGGKKR